MLEDMIAKVRETEETVGPFVYENEEIQNLDMSCMEFEGTVFVKCRFINCSFERSSFIKVEFKNCDLSNCNFISGYWRNSRIENSKGIGSNFSEGSFHGFTMTGSVCHYGNFVRTLWEKSVIEESDLSEVFFSDSRFKSIQFRKVKLTKVNFFKTLLKGIDLSSCNIEGLSVSDSYEELRGVKLSAAQTVDIAVLLGVKIV